MAILVETLLTQDNTQLEDVGVLKSGVHNGSAPSNVCSCRVSIGLAKKKKQIVSLSSKFQESFNIESKFYLENS